MGLFKARNPSLLREPHSAACHFQRMVQQNFPKCPFLKTFRGHNHLNTCI